jgi:hypothetical protein
MIEPQPLTPIECVSCQRLHTDWSAPYDDWRLPGIQDTLGYCEPCKGAWYSSHRDEVRGRYQCQLDTWPMPSYVYALLDPRDRSGLRYIGRGADIIRRMREHRKANDGTREKRAWIADMHEQGLTFEYGVPTFSPPKIPAKRSHCSRAKTAEEVGEAEAACMSGVGT